MNGLRRSDLRYVDYSDCLLIYIDTDIHMCGTYHELFFGELQHKPRFVVIKGGWRKLPTWCIPIFKRHEIFEDFDSCIEHIKRLDDGTITLDDRWVLIRKALKNE